VANSKNKYKQALQIQPDNSYAQAHLQSVNATIQSESETKKRGDSLAASKLRQLNQQMQEDSVAAVRSRLDSAFTRLINAANEAVDKKDFNTAVFSYTEALKLKPGDEFAISQVSKVQQAIIQAQGDSVKQQEVAMSNNEKGIDSIKADVDSGTVDIAASAANEIEKGMLLIKARYFKMGSDVGSTDESPMHSVKLDSFYISRFEVTQSQWQSIMGDNPSFFKNCDDCPVEHVSWYDATKFIERLNQISHKNYRLPTEAEWEYVAGTKTEKMT
jgi:formylglycine-generating enzyme required for sulfatase activity